MAVYTIDELLNWSANTVSRDIVVVRIGRINTLTKPISKANLWVIIDEPVPISPDSWMQFWSSGQWAADTLSWPLPSTQEWGELISKSPQLSCTLSCNAVSPTNWGINHVLTGHYASCSCIANISLSTDYQWPSIYLHKFCLDDGVEVHFQNTVVGLHHF